MHALWLSPRLSLLLGGLAHAQTAKPLGYGDTCHLKDGRLGSCIKLDKCEAAIEDLKKGILPTSCFFEGFKAVLCCPKEKQQKGMSAIDELTSKSQPRPIRSASLTSSSQQSSAGDCLEPVQDWSPTPEEKQFLKNLADQKCTEYRQHTYQQQNIPAPNHGTCQPKRVRRIVGGVPATTQEFPHMAVLGFGKGKDSKWICGGSLISKRHVITAAHCIISNRGCARRVLLGASLLNDTSLNSERQEFEIVRWIRHPNYMPPQRYNDIAILELDRDVDITPYVQPACLYTEFAPPEGAKGIAIGFGRDNWLSVAGSNELLKVSLPFLTYQHCNDSYKTSFRLPYGLYEYGMLCVGDLKGNKDTCQGDAGGPLHVQDINSCLYKIIGITSFGSSVCGAENSPAVYTRVSSYVPWIAKTIWS